MKNKKGLIIATVSIAISITLMITVYETTPILDDVVENVAEVLGTKTEKMIAKEEKKIQEEKAVIENQGTDLTDLKVNEPIQLDSAQLVAEEKRKQDSIVLAKEAERRKIFNTKIDEKAAQRIALEEKMKAEAQRKTDSLAAIAVAEASKPQKKKSLFNTGTTGNVTGKGENNLQFFDAKVHGTQKFQHNEVVEFRTSTAIKLGSQEIPPNVVFSAKANVFDGKVHFIVKSINNVSTSAENYSNTLPGLTLTPDMKLGSGYLMSDGVVLKFGYKL